MQPTILAIVGKPLAGKDTQADLLVAAHPEAVKISTGHILRAVAEEGETHRFWPIVGHLMPMMEAGLKLPDPEVIEMLGRAIGEQVAEGKKLLVIAGSPRSIEQLESFEGMAKAIDGKLVVVHIDATDAETYRRSANRHEGRVDDTPEVHAVRLKEYETHVMPMVEKLRADHNIADIDGMKSIESVFRDMEHVVRTNILDPEVTLPRMARR